MRIALTFLGLDLFSLDVNTDNTGDDDSPGEATAYPIGFSPSHGDQRWEKGLDT